MPIRVAIGEDSLIVREGVRQLLAVDPEVEIVAAVADQVSLRQACDVEDPDVVLTDIRMPPTHTDEGIRLAAELRDTHPQIGVVTRRRRHRKRSWRRGLRDVVRASR